MGISEVVIKRQGIYQNEKLQNWEGIAIPSLGWKEGRDRDIHVLCTTNTGRQMLTRTRVCPS